MLTPRYMLIGRTLGRYQVTAALGAGGMGEVYRATDLTLGRDVAIKVLPADVASDPDRLARFRREARVLASLNHPNIAAIHGFEEIDGTAFLTLELVEGEDLAERLRRGPVATRDALETAKQIAEALEAAHDRGVIHRDLKPANVKVTPEGVVKVLDFGLAKAWAGETSGEHASGNVSLSPTFAREETAAGVILGTAAYMAPEQARGRVVNRRADIWAFGVVLFEMLTGRALFTGETTTDVMAAVVTAEPDLAALPADTPPSIRRLLRRCLQKDPRVRLPDIGSARVELSEVLSGIADEGAGSSAASPLRGGTWRRRLLVPVALAGLLGSVGLAYFAGRRAAPAEASLSPVRFSVQVPPGLRLDPGTVPAVSPDGRYFVLSAESEGRPQLWLRPMDSLVFEPLAGTEGAFSAFWSPDSRHLGFVVNAELRRVALESGGVQKVATLDSAFSAGGAWGPDGTIVISKGLPRRNVPDGATLVAVNASGGQVRPLTVLDEARGELGHFLPQFLPDGRHLAFSVAGDGDVAGVYTTTLEAPTERRRLFAEPVAPQFTRRHVLFVQGNTLMARPYDLRARQAEGDARIVAENVGVFAPANLGLFTSSVDSVIVYNPATVNETQLTWVNRSGGALATLGSPQPYAQIALSPDQKQVAVELPDAAGNFDIWLMDVARGVPTRLTFDSGSDRNPVWSPDGSEIVFGSDRGGPAALYRKSVVTGAPEGRLFETPATVYPESWTPDGRSILYQDQGTVEGGRTAWIAPVDGSGQPVVLVHAGFQVDELQVSPDGRLFAYISAESGRYEVYVAPLLKPGPKVRVSIDGGGQPKWRRDGRELFFVSRGKVHAVEIRPDAEPLAGLPQPLFDLDTTGPDYDDYAPAADGQRFLVKRRVAGASAAVHVVMHWDR